MADSINVFPPSLRVTDADGNPVAGAKLKFFEAGTSTPLTVYSDDGLTTSLGTVVYCDSAGYPVTAEGGSTKTLIYAGTTDYKLTITDADDVTIAEHDDNPGALDTSGFTVTSAAPSMPVLTRATSSWSVASDAPGTLYRCNVAGSSQTVSFPSAVTAGDGYLFGLQYDGPASSNTVTYQTVSGQTIADGADAEAASGTLTENGQTKWFVSDGAGWRVAFAKQGRLDRGLVIVIADRLTAAPSSPTAGARYIVNGTPTGTWAALSFAEHDIVEADGQGGWIQYSPGTDCGWLAYVQDENLLTQFRASAWVDLSNITAPAASYVPTLIVRLEQSNGTAGGTAADSAWTKYPLSAISNSAADNYIAGTTLTSSVISGLPVGLYRISGQASFKATDHTRLRLRNTSTSADAVLGSTIDIDSANGVKAFVPLLGEFEVTDAAHTYEVQYYAQNGGGSNQLGTASEESSTEVYGEFIIEDLERIQGTQGATGSQGATGRDAGHWRYTFSTADTSETDPGSGAFKLDNATIASVTELYISATDADSGDADAFWATVDDSTSSIKGQLVFRKANTPGTVLVLDIDGTVTDNMGWWTVPVAYNSGALPSNSDSMLLTFVPTGDAGVTTAGIVFDFDGGASNIEADLKARVQVPFACTIQEATLVADTTGSIVVDVWKDSYANYPPTVADTITSSAKPTLSSAQKYQDATLTGWTTSISAGDFLIANVDSASGINNAVLTLKVQRS